MHRRRGPEQLNVWGVSISTSRSLIAIDKLGLLLYRWSTVSVGGNRQAAADKHLDPIQTISLCLLQEARSDRSKRAGGGRINGSGGRLPVSLVHSHPLPSPSLSPRLPLVNLAVSDLRRTLTRSPGPCSLLATVSHHLAALPVYRCCLSLRIYAASLCCLQEVVEKAAWDEFPAFI